ncbi:MAG: DUF4886 domain-containing protein [Kiritimatiellae bacterium]|nr:DUF4886 domain-containing protein [Kiritimatiellia bacterium]
MKRTLWMVLAVAAVATAWAKETKVLIIGNSFSVSVMRNWPQLAKASGSELKAASMYIGGCSFQRHWENVEKASNDTFKPYDIWISDTEGVKRFKSNIPQMLVTDKWDYVTIQQASPSAWDPETYHPYADKLIAKIKELAPQAEIVIQQTWAYSNLDNRIQPGGAWKFDQTGQYERTRDAYASLAKQYKFRMIPTGLAVQKFRQALPVTLVHPTREQLAKYKKPETPDLGGEVVGRFSWKKPKDGKGEEKLSQDATHLNPSGEYLQALVWQAFFFGTDVTKTTYAPAYAGGKDRAALLQSCAVQAVKEGATAFNFR